MALIKWQDEFNTGISGVDHEHQELIKQINSIFELIEKKADKEHILDLLGDIYGSISAHFSLEEQLMEKHGYDHFVEHQADHKQLLDDIRDITIEFENSTALDEEKFKHTLNDWFQIHFGTHDARLHGLAHIIDHKPVCESKMKTMIRNAKNALLGKTG